MTEIQNNIEKYYSVQQAREELFKHYDEKGEHCPVCGQYVKLYKRKINSSMAHAIIILYHYNRNHPAEWMHILEYFTGMKLSTAFGDAPKLRHWGLIEKKEGEKEDGNPDNGYYRITQKGIDFVEKKLQISKYVFLYNNEVKYRGEKLTDIEESLGDKFDYTQLMSGGEYE